MKAKEVLRLLGITRPTLTQWVKIGKIKVIELPNGYYDYFDEDIYRIIQEKNKERTNMAVNTQEKESLISCGLNLSNISDIEEMKAIINNKGLDIASEIILDLRDRINRLTNYISEQKEPSILKDKNRKLFEVIRDIKHYIQQKEENILYYDKVFNL